MQDRARRSAQRYALGSTRSVAVVGVIVAALVVVSGGAFALGDSPPLTAPLAVTTPIVDGSIKPAGEWADAGRLPLAGPFATHPGTLYVKHDATYLYVLLTITDDPPPSGILCCSASIFFDNDHDGVRDQGEDAMAFGPADQSSDQFFSFDPFPEYIYDSVAGGTEDTVAAGSYDAADRRLVLEARKPLCSGDSHDFCVKVGSTLGFTLDYFASNHTDTLDYPTTPDDFAHFGDLHISPTPLLADLAVQAKADQQSVNVGENVTSTMSVTNNGPESATAAVLDADYKLSGVTAALPPRTCPCKLATLAPRGGTTIRQTIIATSVAQGGGTILLKAAVSATESDPSSTNNTDQVAVKVTSAPSAGEAVAARTSAGAVTVRTAGAKTFVPLKKSSIATGSEVDASKGSVQVTSATPARKLQTVTAAAGRFRVLQRKKNALTTLLLTASLKCRPGTGTTVLRRLRVDVNGKFETRGARGWAMPETPQASWLTTDVCVPVGRRLAGVSAKKPNRTVKTCYTNTSKRSEICAYDPESRSEKMVPPKKKACV